VFRTQVSLLAVAALALAACSASGDVTAPSHSVPPTETPSAAGPGEPWIVSQAGAGDGDGLYLVRPDQSGWHLISGDLPAFSYHPDWSPDGTRIAFELGQDRSEIWAMDPDGSETIVLAPCPAATCNMLGSPAWSPDGTELAYVREDPPGVARPGFGAYVEVRDLATGKTRVVAKPGPVGDEYVESGAPRWSPDGKRLVVTVTHWTNPPTEPMVASSIAVVATDGSDAGNPRILTDPGLFGAYPDWSPDGEWIVFNTHDLAGFQETTKAANLYRIKPDGTGLTQITRFGENDTRATQPSWTPDGLRIIFTWVGRVPDNSYGARKAALIDADGSNLTVLDDVWTTHPRLQPTP
jgi:Tol biopolymer transport system component